VPSDGCMPQRRRVATLLRRRGHGRKSGLRGRPHRLRASLSLSLVSARSSRVACIVAHAHTRVQNQLYAQHRRRCAQHNDRTRQGGKLTQSAEPVALLGVSTGVALHDSALTQWNRIACKSPHVESPRARGSFRGRGFSLICDVQCATIHHTPYTAQHACGWLRNRSLSLIFLSNSSASRRCFSVRCASPEPHSTYNMHIATRSCQCRVPVQMWPG
jgi:hypothetical protein